MVRKLAAALLGAGVMIPGLVQALGLGEIKVHSALSEPLNAEIQLVQLRSLAPEEIIVHLASNAEFASQGIERFPYLNDLRFDVVVGEGGRSFIKVTSRKPMREPYVDFLVEVTWPQGKVVREMTALLDPQVYRKQAAPEINRPAAVSTSSRVAPSVSSAPAKVAEHARGNMSDGSYGPTGSSDSLWNIARQARPSGKVTVHQTMLAIQKLNPSAFVNGNINLLKRGQVLRLPGEDDVLSISAAEAAERVSEQNRAWRDKTPVQQRDAQVAPVNASGAANSGSSGAARPDGKLSLVSASDSGAPAVTETQAGGGSGGILRDKLAVAEEHADSLKLQNDDLKSRVGDLEQRTQASSEVLKLKDDQIAALQSRLADMQAEIEKLKASQSPGANASANTSPTPAAAAPAAEASAPVASSIKPDVPTEESNASEPVVDYNTQKSTVAIEDVRPAVLEPHVPPHAAAPEAPVSELNVLDRVSESPWIMGGGVMALVAAALAVAFRRGRAERPSARPVAEAVLPRKQAKPVVAQPVEQTPAVSAPVSVAASPAPDALTPDIAAIDVVSALGAIEPDSRTVTTSQTADVVGEADIYLAYGRFPQAIEMLERALEGEPDRQDVRLKLVEVASESRDRALYDRHAGILLDGGDRAVVSKVRALGAVFGPSTTSEPVVAPAVAPKADDFAPIEFTPSITLPEPEQEAKPDHPLDFSVDFEPVAQPVSDTAGTHDELSLDFDFGLSEDIQPVAPAPVAAVPSDADDSAFSLDFDADIDSDTVLGAFAGDDTTNASVKSPMASDGLLLPEGDANMEFSAEADEVATKLDLARAYIDMGDRAGASDILDEVMAEGNASQKAEARELQSRL